MQQRCPGAVSIGTFALADHRFIINERGVATIAGTRADERTKIQPVVLGVLWECTDEHLTTLDRFEGVAEGRYYRAQVPVSPLNSGKAVELALVYIDPIREPGPPRPGYLERVINGAREHHLPNAYITGTLEPLLRN